MSASHDCPRRIIASSEFSLKGRRRTARVKERGYGVRGLGREGRGRCPRQGVGADCRARVAPRPGCICSRPRPGRVLQGRALRAVVHLVGRPGLRPGPHVGLHRPGHRQAHGLLRPRRAPHPRPGRNGAVAHGGRPLLGPRLLPRRGARLLVRRARGLVREGRRRHRLHLRPRQGPFQAGQACHPPGAGHHGVALRQARRHGRRRPRPRGLQVDDRLAHGGPLGLGGPHLDRRCGRALGRRQPRRDLLGGALRHRHPRDGGQGLRRALRLPLARQGLIHRDLQFQRGLGRQGADGEERRQGPQARRPHQVGLYLQGLVLRQVPHQGLRLQLNREVQPYPLRQVGGGVPGLRNPLQGRTALPASGRRRGPLARRGPRQVGVGRLVPPLVRQARPR